jgi:hypothetical protein
MKFGLIGAIVFTAACGANRTPRDQLASPSCAGRVYAVVTNDWDRSIDVYAVVPPISTARVIGSVGPGERQSVVLPDSARYPYLRTREQGHVSEIPREFQELARMRVTCESSRIE